MHRLAEKNGIAILRHYIDRAYSAKTDKRPEFLQMIKDSGKHLFDMVFVWKLNRFSRNRYDSARYKAVIKKNGVRVVSAIEVISESAEGIILESVLEGYVEYYSADLAEKDGRGMTENALKCRFNGGNKPVGYVIDAEQHFQIDSVTAPHVLEAFKRYAEGATMKELVEYLTEHGVRNTYGEPLNLNSVQHMLKNRRYLGKYAFRDIVIPDGIPTIVPKDLFGPDKGAKCWEGCDSKKTLTEISRRHDIWVGGVMCKIPGNQYRVAKFGNFVEFPVGFVTLK